MAHGPFSFPKKPKGGPKKILSSVPKRKPIEKIVNVVEEIEGDAGNEEKEVWQRAKILEEELMRDAEIDGEMDEDSECEEDEAPKGAKGAKGAKAKKRKKTVVERNAPDNVFRASQQLEICFAYGKQLGILLSRLSVFGDKMVLDFHPTNGLYVKLMHVTNVVVVYLNIPVVSFLRYNLESPKTFVLKHTTIKAMTRVTRANQTLTFYYEDESSVLRARAHSEDSDKTMSLTIIDEDLARRIPQMDFRKWTYMASATLHPRAFNDLIDDCDRFETSEISYDVDVENGKLLITGFKEDRTDVSEFDGAYAAVVTRTGEIASDTYPIGMTKQIANIHGVSSEVTMHFGSGLPLWLEYTFTAVAGEAPLGTIDIIQMTK